VLLQTVDFVLDAIEATNRIMQVNRPGLIWPPVSPIKFPLKTW